MPWQRRIAAAITVASFAGFSSWELSRRAHPWGDLSNGFFTDHFSHMNAARLFPRAFAREWTTPLVRLLPRLSPGERAALPKDVVDCSEGCLFHVDGWPAQKPMEQSWPMVVRPYPPGDLLLFAPIAALYHLTPLSASTADRLLVIVCLSCAHAAIFLLLDRARGPLAVLCALLGASALVHWSLEGFYDAAMVVPLLLCAGFLAAGSCASALLAFGAAMLLHFRALYYVPWAIAAAAMLFRSRRALRKPDVAKVLAAALCLAASLTVFVLVLPGLLAFPVQNNPLYVRTAQLDAAALREGAAVAAVSGAAFGWARAPLDVAMVAWVFLVVTQVRQNYGWYDVALVPWLCAPAQRPVVRLARLAVFVFLAVRIHADSIWPRWIAAVHA